MSHSGRVSRGKLPKSKKGSTSANKSTSIPKRKTTQEITSKKNPNNAVFLTSNYEDNRDSPSRSSSKSSSSSSGSSSNSSSEESGSSDEESEDVNPYATFNDTLGIFCDWHSVHCLRTDPGYENLELKRCQHPGGTCQKISSSFLRSKLGTE